MFHHTRNLQNTEMVQVISVNQIHNIIILKYQVKYGQKIANMIIVSVLMANYCIIASTSFRHTQSLLFKMSKLHLEVLDRERDDKWFSNESPASSSAIVASR